MNKKNDEITLKSLAEIFIPKLWIIALVSVVAAALFGGYSILKEDKFTSQGTYMVVKVPYENTTTTAGLNSGEIDAMQGMIENAKVIISTDDFCEGVLARLAMIDDSKQDQFIAIKSQYEADVAALNKSTSDIKVQMEAVALQYESAVEALDKEADDYIASLADLKVKYEEDKEALEAKIEENAAAADVLEMQYNSDVAAVSSVGVKALMGIIKVSYINTETTCYTLSATTADAELSRSISAIAGDLLLEKFINMGYAIEIQKVGSPRLAESPDGKNTLRNAVIGLAAGFIISALAIFVISKFDVVVRTRERLEDNFDVPILGVIPKLEAEH